MPAARPLPPQRAVDKIAEALLTGGTRVDDLPEGSRVVFAALVDKLAARALEHKDNGDLASYEEGVLQFIVQISKALRLARGGRRGLMAAGINARLNAMLQEREPWAVLDERADEQKAVTAEQREGKDEKEEAPPAPRPASAERDEVRRWAAAQRAVRANQVGKGARVLSHRLPLPAFTEAVKNEMSAKIPQLPPVRLPNLPDDAPVISYTHKSKPFFRAITLKSREGASAGPSRLTHRHIQRVCESEIGRKFVASVCSDLRNGRFSAAIKPIFCSSVGTAIPKTATTNRPVCSGDVFRRIVSSDLAVSYRDQLSAAAGDFQTGAGARDGCEKICHTVQACLDAGITCIELDISNAFSTRSRISIMKTLKANSDLSDLLRFFHFTYSTPSRVMFMQNGKVVHTLQSCEGVEQGDPLGTALFAVDLAQDIKKAQADHPGVLFLAYADNVFILGPQQLLPAAASSFKSYASINGSQVSLPKSRAIYWNAAATPILDSFSEWLNANELKLEEGAVKILGSAIGPSRTPAEASALAKQILDKNEAFFANLLSPHLHSQVAMSLLRLCGPGRAVHLSRCARPSVTAAALQAFDASMFSVVIARAGVQPHEWTTKLQKQIALPLRLGGFGIRSATANAHIAWFSGQAAAAAFMSKALLKFSIPVILEASVPLALENEAALGNIKATVRLSTQVLLPERASETLLWYSNSERVAACPKLQRALTASAEEAVASTISNHSDATTSQLIAARCEPLAHIWKESIPLSPSLELSDDQFSLSFRVEFGLPPEPVQDKEAKVRCGFCCKFILARDQTHYLNCQYTAGHRIRRHNEVSRLMAEGIREVHGIVALEVRHLWGKDNSKPDLDVWLGSKRSLVDVTIRNDMAISMRGRDVIALAEKEKTDHYEAMAIGSDTIPAVGGASVIGGVFLQNRTRSNAMAWISHCHHVSGSGMGSSQRSPPPTY